MPFVGVDGEAVEVRNGAFWPEPLLELLQLERNVRDRRVQLTGDEVALSERAQELRQLLAALRDQLEHEQERDHAGVRLREVAEVVVAGDLAAENRALLAHPVLEECVADTVHERHAAALLDRLRHRPARSYVVEDLGAGLLLEHGAGQESRDEVARDELAGVIDEEASVSVAVERHSEIGALVGHLPDDELAVLGQQRIGLVVGERPVRLEVVTDRVDRQPLENRRQHRACHAVGGVDHDP